MIPRQQLVPDGPSYRPAREYRPLLLIESSRVSYCRMTSSTAGEHFRCCAKMGLPGGGQRWSVWCWRVRTQLHQPEHHWRGNSRDPGRPGAAGGVGAEVERRASATQLVVESEIVGSPNADEPTMRVRQDVSSLFD